MDRALSTPEGQETAHDLYKDGGSQKHQYKNKTKWHKRHYCKCGACLNNYKYEGKAPHVQRARARRNEKSNNPVNEARVHSKRHDVDGVIDEKKIAEAAQAEAAQKTLSTVSVLIDTSISAPGEGEKQEDGEAVDDDVAADFVRCESCGKEFEEEEEYYVFVDIEDGLIPQKDGGAEK